jgi:hypothetical protein
VQTSTDAKSVGTDLLFALYFIWRAIGGRNISTLLFGARLAEAWS